MESKKGMNFLNKQETSAGAQPAGKRKAKKMLSQSHMIALGFLMIILVGTGLLMLPVSSKSGETTDFISALFPATSATCVTGLVVYDTYTHWSVFGQLIILTMIQIGGLGFMSVGVFLPCS